MTDRLTEIFSAENDTLSYEWNEFHVYLDTEATSKSHFVCYDDSGCSCNHYEPPMSPIFYTRYDRLGVLNAFSAWAQFMTPLNFTRNLDRLISTLNKYR
jgi:hypothetical protein